MVSRGGPVFFSGNIEVICGPMFSGKTEELLRRVRRAQIAKQEVQIFKPKIDNRYHETDVVSHIGQSIPAIAVRDSKELMKNVAKDTKVIGIDEIQFFDTEICGLVSDLANKGVRVICAGLDQDHMGIPFGPIPYLLAIADEADKVHAVCTVCGMAATKTLRINSEVDDKIFIGEKDSYEARCRNHYPVRIEFEKSFHNLEVSAEDRNIER